MLLPRVFTPAAARLPLPLYDFALLRAMPMPSHAAHYISPRFDYAMAPYEGYGCFF